MISPSLEMPWPYMMSNSTSRNGGATLFLTTFTRTELPTISSRFFTEPVRRMSRRTGSVKNRDEIVGNSVRVKVVKNKVAPPFREVEFDIMYGQGISKLGEIIDLGVKAGVVEKSGSWFSYNSQRIGQGRDNARDFLKANPGTVS